MTERPSEERRSGGAGPGEPAPPRRRASALLAPNHVFAAAAALLRERGAELGMRFPVLRDGERPRARWIPAAASAILVLLVAVNLRALLKRVLAPGP